MERGGHVSGTAMRRLQSGDAVATRKKGNGRSARKVSSGRLSAREAERLPFPNRP